MDSRIYQSSLAAGDLRFETGAPSIVTLDDQPLRRRGDDQGLRGPDVRILGLIISGAAIDATRVFTVVELWNAGWPDEKIAADSLISKEQRNSVSGAVSRIRRNAPQLLDPDQYRLAAGRTIRDVTPTVPTLRDAHRITIASMIAVFVTVLIDAPVRAILEGAHLTVIQPSDLSAALSFILGGFQGFFGALIWSLALSATLLYLWIVVDRLDPWKRRFPLLLNAFTGGLVGFAAGLFNSMALLFAQHTVSLQLEGWIPKGTDDRWTAFTQTGLGCSMPWFGTFVGAGAGFITMWIIKRRAWASLIGKYSKITTPQVAFESLFAIFRLALRWCGAFLFPPMLASAFIFWLLWHRHLNLLQLFGESFVIACGGAALVTGLLVGLFALAKGIDVVADFKCGLIPGR